MIFLTILILIVAVALASINHNISKYLYVVISSIIFICIGALAFYAFYIQSIGSGTGIYSGSLPLSAIISHYLIKIIAVISHYLFSLSSTELIILKKIILFLTWFIIGVYSYLNLLSPNLKNKINNLTLFELIIIFFTFFYILNLIAPLIDNYFFSLHQPDLPIYNSMVGNTNTIGSHAATKSTMLDRAGDAAIMGTALGAGAKIAQQMPNGAAKAAFLAGSVALGGAAIIVKNVAGKLSDKFNNYISNINQIYNSLYNLSGNDAVDLLNLIQVFQKLEILFLFLIFYNLFVLYINENLLEFYLNKVFPTKLVQIYIKSLKILKKSSFVIIICSLILLLISSIYAHYYLQFFIDNLDKIIEFYFKK